MIQKRRMGSRMHGFFGTAIAEEYSAGAADLEAIVENCRSDRMTGMIQALDAAGIGRQLLLSRGQIIGTYLRTGNDIGSFGQTDWQAFFEGGPAVNVHLVYLPAGGLRMARLIAERGEPDEECDLETAAISSLVETWQRRLQGCAVLLSWSRAEAILILPEGSKAIRDVLLLAGGQVDMGLDAYAQILGWAEGACVARRFLPVDRSPAWAEYDLHYAFSLLAEKFLQRYEQFTGRILVNSVARDLAITAERAGWVIGIRGTVIDDQSLSATTAEAAITYRELLSTILHHMTVVLGSRMVGTITLEAMGELGSPDAELVRRHELLPQGAVGAGT